jgi:hypothetical protein
MCPWLVTRSFRRIFPFYNKVSFFKENEFQKSDIKNSQRKKISNPINDNINTFKLLEA